MPRVDEDSKGNQVIRADSDLPDDEDGKGYIWYEMGLFTQWKKAGHSRALCIDAPEKLQSELQSALQSRDITLNFSDPFALHTSILDQMFHLYDTSVWRVRNPVRKVEKARETIKKERAERKKRPNDESVSHTGFRDAARGFKTRYPRFRDSVSDDRNPARLTDAAEVNLPMFDGSGKDLHRASPRVFELSTPTSSQPQGSISLEPRKAEERNRIGNSFPSASTPLEGRQKPYRTQAYTVLVLQDSEVMRTVALLTMILLPPTFLSTFFSTTFFSFEESGWRVSRAIWIYFIIAVPVTLICLGSWHVWLYGTGKARAILNKYVERRRTLAARGGVQSV
ncbi:hypothetical protein LTR84_011240 [Exophiala bonariae]|uniref:Uncharacterized protein n=1 Tax=Exophiala bonariae TaxID=1690606 RepID=A0AAV9MSH2_9EURO|nr:hypothetical protein LTR84_011240 [Exophiala bonariae]